MANKNRYIYFNKKTRALLFKHSVRDLCISAQFHIECKQIWNFGELKHDKPMLIPIRGQDQKNK